MYQKILYIVFLFFIVNKKSQQTGTFHFNLFSRSFAVISKDLENEELEKTATHSTFIVLVNWNSVIVIVTR